MIKSPLPVFKIKTEPLSEDAELAERHQQLCFATSRAEKMLDILDFTLHASDYDLRHSWCYWEDFTPEEKNLYWKGCFAAGKTAFITQQKGPDQDKWPGWLVTWCKR